MSLLQKLLIDLNFGECFEINGVPVLRTQTGAWSTPAQEFATLPEIVAYLEGLANDG